MHCTKKVTDTVTWLGAGDRRLALFENLYPVPQGASYNAYLIRGEKNILMDTVDRAVCPQFLENLTHALAGEPLHYIVVNHMEPDHCACLAEIISRWQDAVIVGNRRTFCMIGQYFGLDISARSLTVEDGSVLDTGTHRLRFILAPMVHWPETMVTYEEHEKILFSADAFGSFGALDGDIFASGDISQSLPEMRRYYTNIVGGYGMQVSMLLDKAGGLDIRMICPLHGHVMCKDIGTVLEKYRRWSSYTPEDRSAVIFCGTIHGHTQNAADILAAHLSDIGVHGTRVYDVSCVHSSYLVAEAFRAECLIFASATYNGGIFTPMLHLLQELAAHGLRHRKVGFIENGSWAPSAARQMAQMCSSMKDMELLGTSVTITSAVTQLNSQQLLTLAHGIKAALTE